MSRQSQVSGAPQSGWADYYFLKADERTQPHRPRSQSLIDEESVHDISALLSHSLLLMQQNVSVGHIHREAGGPAPNAAYEFFLDYEYFKEQRRWMVATETSPGVCAALCCSRSAVDWTVGTLPHDGVTPREYAADRASAQPDGAAEDPSSEESRIKTVLSASRPCLCCTSNVSVFSHTSDSTGRESRTRLATIEERLCGSCMCPMTSNVLDVYLEGSESPDYAITGPTPLWMCFCGACAWRNPVDFVMKINKESAARANNTGTSITMQTMLSEGSVVSGASAGGGASAESNSSPNWVGTVQNVQRGCGWLCCGSPPEYSILFAEGSNEVRVQRASLLIVAMLLDNRWFSVMSNKSVRGPETIPMMSRAGSSTQ